MYFYGIDSTYIMLVIPAMIFALWAQTQVKGTFNRYSTLRNRNGYTGSDVARQILDRNGLHSVKIEHIKGNMTDHFDPRTNVVRLSDTVYNSTSVAAVGVAAHECGHAIQFSESYTPMKIRQALIPITNLVSQLSFPLILFGIFFDFTGLISLGILFFAGAVITQVVTLPVEFNASSRALEILDSTGMLNDEELSGSKKVLNAAAMTYVAATVVAMAQLLRLLILYGGRRRD